MLRGQCSRISFEPFSTRSVKQKKNCIYTEARCFTSRVAGNCQNADEKKNPRTFVQRMAFQHCKRDFFSRAATA